jgi:hypothetical protein
VTLPAVARRPGVALFHILALPGNNIWVTGGSAAAMALHYQDRRWHVYQRPAGDILGQAVPDGRGGIWAAYESTSDLTTMVRIQAGHWQQVRLPGARAKHPSVTALARLPRSGTVFAAGSLFWGSSPSAQTRGLILRYIR